MPGTIVVGGQYGSEGKGKVVSLLAREWKLLAWFDAAVRTLATVSIWEVRQSSCGKYLPVPAF